MKKKTNYYTFEAANVRISGDFNIYQSRNGAIHILLGALSIQLTREQVNGISFLYDLKDFDKDTFNMFYNF